MDLQSKTTDFKKLIDHAQNDLGTVRTNRATPAMLENLKVEAYGVKMPLVQVASLTAPEPRQLLVEPWDKNILKDVEKAVESAALGLSVKNEGNFLRLSISPMTEETRRQIIKVLHEKLETARVALRGLRDKIKEEIVTAERKREIGEDEKYKLIEELDKITRERTEEINEMGEKKEKEVML